MLRGKSGLPSGCRLRESYSNWIQRGQDNILAVEYLNSSELLISSKLQTM